MTSVAVVTGSASGIGRATAVRLSSAGYYVVGVDITSSDAANQSIVADLATCFMSENDCVKLSRKIKDAIANFDLEMLVNCAAEQITGRFEELEIEKLRRTLEVNVVSAYALAQMCFKELVAAKGCIVNIGSIHASLTKSGFSVYATSKGALDSMTRSLSVELAPDVQVIGIRPGAVDTPMLNQGFVGNPENRQRLAEYHPTGSVGRADEVADIVEFISRKEGAFLNGSIIDVNGGIGGRLHDPV